MKQLFHSEWTNKRVKKIIDIFGKNWFYEKNILELGACHGDVGIQLLTLGANVHFTDARMDNLSIACEKLKDCAIDANVSVLNQENVYDLGHYDLVVHMATLCHISNWRQDLQCATNHSNLMILETSVMPIEGSFEREYQPYDHSYGPFTKNTMHEFTESAVEDELKNLGCAFIKITDSDLNCYGWSHNNVMFHNVYDWKYNDVKDSKDNKIFSYRRMWLVLNSTK